MTEKEIERRMRELVRQRGGLFYKFLSPNNPGVPDRILISPTGVVWFVELKTNIGRLSKIQTQQIGKLEKRGVNIRIIRGWEAAKKFIDEVMGDGIHTA